MHICPKSRLMDASAGIVVGGIHVANWFIGQIRPETMKLEKLHRSADSMGIDRKAFLEAYEEIPVMSGEQFNRVSELLYMIINQFTDKALLRLKYSEDESGKERSKQIIEYGESNFYDIFQSVNEGVAYTTLPGKVLAINEPLERMLGIPKEMIVGKNIVHLAKSLLKGESAASVVPHLKALVTGKKMMPFRVEFNGRILEVSADISLKTRRLTGVIRDITEQVRTEDVLRQSEERFRTVFVTSPDSVNIIRLKDGIYVAVNEGFESLSGYREEDIVGKKAADIGLWVNEEDQLNVRKELIERGHIENYEAEFRLKNGIIRKGLISASIIDLEGEPHIISITRDIHDRFLMIQDLRKAKEKAEESDRLKSAFLANMSHEIRTPMNGILGFAELLKSPELSGEKQKQYISIIEKSGIRMLNIINDLIDISKVESGQMDVNLMIIDVTEVINDLIRFFKPETDKKGLELRFGGGADLKELYVETDREKLYAVLTNLIKNAVKFCHEGLIEIGVENLGSFARFYVSDTGIGIQKDKIDTIFDRFVQADPLESSSQQGAGLGLAISKAYVELLKGRILVASEKGVGTTFIFEIPGVKEVPQAKDASGKASTESSVPVIKNLNILIVEDEVVSDTYLSILLEESGNIFHASTGYEAIRICSERPELDLILMDIGLPDIDGIEVTRRIRELRPDVVIIAQTAFSFDGDRERALAAGCNAYLSKPINRVQLFKEINSCFR